MKHPHAENMMLYAQDALETDKPWELWELFVVDEWVNISQSPLWHENSQYRRKPRTLNINGFEVPEPVREPLKDGVVYYFPCIENPELAGSYTWRNDHVDNVLLERHLIYLDRESAIIHAKALLSFTEEKK